MDNCELSTQQELEEVFNRSIKNNNGLGVLIDMPGYEFPELIINPPENLEKKLAYYKATYDENLNHKHAEGIRIVGYAL